MLSTIDLDSYFARIGYNGPENATLLTLRPLHFFHAAAIPFENLDPLLGEQNTLQKAVLAALGFYVTGLSARAVWMTPPDRQPNSRAHMALKVDTDEGSDIADVGFGGFLIAGPIKLMVGLEQQTPSGMLRVVEVSNLLVLQAQFASGWRDLYQFTLEPQFAIDYKVANWFTSTHPNSQFWNDLLIERLTSEVRTSLFNRRLTRHLPDGRIEEKILSAPDELAHSLNVELNLEPPSDAAALFARLPRPGVGRDCN